MPGFKVFGNDPLLPAEVNDYLMEQAVIVCTAATNPASPHEGMFIYETDTDLYKMYSGTAWVTAVQPGAWTSFTPQVYGTATGLQSLDATSASRYRRIGRSIRWHGFAKFDPGLDSTTETLELALPISAQASVLWLVGNAYGYDNSGNVIIEGLVTLASSTRARITYTAGTGPTGTGTFLTKGSSGTPFVWTTDDLLLWTIEYESAS